MKTYILKWLLVAVVALVVSVMGLRIKDTLAAFDQCDWSTHQLHQTVNLYTAHR